MCLIVAEDVAGYGIYTERHAGLLQTLATVSTFAEIVSSIPKIPSRAAEEVAERKGSAFVCLSHRKLARLLANTVLPPHEVLHPP